jgi:2-methylcitrate dehydratase PrpD
MLTAIGAALACAKLLSLSPEAIVDAIALASCQFALSDELKRSPQSDLRAVRDGFAARAAVEATLLAQRGVRGVEKPLEGKSGLIAMLTGRPSLHEACLVDGFGEHFHGTAVGIKRWPSCRGTHSAIAAAHALRQKGLGPDDVGSVSVIVTPPNDMLFLPRAQRVWPHTAIDAKFSIPFVFASTMVHGTIGLESFLPERLSEAQISGLAEKVTMSDVIQTDAFEARYKVRTCDGHDIEETVVAIPVWQASDIALQDLKGKVAGCAGVARTPFEAEAFLSAVSMTDTAGIEPVMAML